jgi:hypothetical protein
MIETQGKPTQAWFVRPFFSPKQKLTAHSLNQILDDQLQREALLARALHGHGVVFGLEVRAEGGPELKLTCGLALDRHGRMLYREAAELHYDRLAGPHPDAEGRYVLSIHYAERREEKSGCGPCESAPEWIEQGVVFTLRPHCEPPHRSCPDIPDGSCINLDEYLCLRTGAHSGDVPPQPDLKWGCVPQGQLCRTECGWRYDDEAGVPLALVHLLNIRGDADCDPIWAFAERVDNCSVRSFVSRTPLLLELIRGCHTDLPKVQEFSWQEWTLAGYDAEVAWDDFRKRCENSRGFQIRFTKAIHVGTIHPGSIFLTAIISDADADFNHVLQIPLDSREPFKFLDRDGDYASWIQLNINKNWKDNQVRGNYGSLYFRGGRIELTIRGQLLRDFCGNMLDARLIGHSPRGPEHLRAGDDFVALFRVVSYDAGGPRRLPDRKQQNRRGSGRYEEAQSEGEE